MGRQRSVEVCIACQCAPVLLGIKPSNILMAKGLDDKEIARTFYATEIKCRKLASEMWLVYRPEQLQARLLSREHQRFLKQYGYQEYKLDLVLRRLAGRIQCYRDTEVGFPHEMGVFLGYPLEDVEGFIKNRGQRYKISGYWKVYGDVDAAKQLFSQYKKAREYAVENISNGGHVQNLIVCQRNGQVL